MEGIPTKRRTPESIEKLEREQVREKLFEQLVAGKLLSHFEEELEETDIAPATMTEIQNTFLDLSEEDKKAVLAIPAQLRPQLFARYASEIQEGKTTGKEMVLNILFKAKKYGFTLGYHLSNAEIRPEKDGSWVVKGTEKDHRHEDRLMAYYSRDYKNRYLKKPAEYLYLVRAELNENSGHYPDNNGTWGHASTLSIVDALNMFELEKDLDTELAVRNSTTPTENENGDAKSMASP